MNENVSNKYLKAAMVIIVTIALAAAISKISSVASGKNEVKERPTVEPIKLENPDPRIAVKGLFFSVRSKDKIQHIDIKKAKILFDMKRVTFVDTRGLNDYKKGHIPGAIHIGIGTFKEDIVINEEKMRGRLLVTYCSGIRCEVSEKMAERLFDEGYKKLAIFHGGWPDWAAAKFPVETQ